MMVIIILYMSLIIYKSKRNLRRRQKPREDTKSSGTQRGARKCQRGLLYRFQLQYGEDLFNHLLWVTGAVHHVVRGLLIQGLACGQHFQHLLSDRTTGQRGAL